MALSQDLRCRIVDLVNSGTSRRQAARHFQVSVSSAIRFAKQAAELGHVEVAPRKPRKSRLDPFHDEILAWIASQPDLTLAEMSARFVDEHGMRVPVSTLDDWLRARQITYKKTAHASEQDRSDVQAARTVWRKRQAWLHAHPGHLSKIVFIDETGLNTKMARLRGRAKRGERLVASIPHGHWKTLTFIAALRHDRLIAPWVIDGPMDGDTFVKYITTQLAPTLDKGDVVILDNLPAHKRKEAEKAVKQRGAWLLFLPPYSPDFNPIERAFSKLKAHLKRIAPRTITQLWKAAGKICDLFTPQECKNFFKADGYGLC